MICRACLLVLVTALPVRADDATDALAKELRDLRHRYKTAYTSYMHCVKALSDASQNGVWPPAEVLRLEEQALNDLTFLRQALLDALHAHTHDKVANSAK